MTSVVRYPQTDIRVFLCRPGSLIAGTWAAMQYMGSEYVPHLVYFEPNPHLFASYSGYLQSCRDIVTCARHIANTITGSIPELYVLGSPPASVVAFGSRDGSVNVYEVGDRMSKRGWHLNALSGPAAVHIACTVCCLSLSLGPRRGDIVLTTHVR